MKKHSQVISEFLAYLKQADSDYLYSYSQVGGEDKKSGDLLHYIEFSVNAAERNRIAKELKVSRKNRRQHKDIAELTVHIHDLLQDAQFKSAVKQLERALGEIRKTESYHERRTYRPKV